MQPDYSRQMLLREVGASGQATLRAARVLVVGAGGLGSPVIQYLAGAGVGCLGLVDADRLDASNLHRQPLYSLSEVGQFKVALASAAAGRINPDVIIETHCLRLTADNAQPLLRAYDLVVDCTDNFRTKFLINDAAVLTRRPAVFASVYQLEGQVQVYRPVAEHACLRCVWADATLDGVVGNCAEAGVLGPVPGIFGSLQALMVLKLLLGMTGTLAGELLLMDFAAFTSVRLKAPRRAACVAPGCALVKSLTAEADALEVTLASLAEAGDYVVIDIRTDEEVAASPTPGRHIEMTRLLADPALLPAGSRYLLLCASGKRSLAAATALRSQGVTASSLAGGLSAIKP